MEQEQEMWSVNDQRKDPEELYFENLTNEHLRVSEVFDRLVVDGKITENSIVQFGAQSLWLWIDQAKYYDKFVEFAEREYTKAKDNTFKLQDRVKAIMKDMPKIDKFKENNMGYIADLASKSIAFGTRLQEAELELRSAVRTYKYGQFDKRKVLEVYPSLQSKQTIMIHFAGDETGKYWDYMEVLAEREKKKGAK